MAQLSEKHLDESKEADNLQDVLHELRKSIDAIIKWTGELKVAPNAEVRYEKQGAMQREIALVCTKLQEAKMWAGKCLEAIDSPFPEELRDEAK